MDYKAEIITEVSETLQDLQVQPILFIGSGLSQRYKPLQAGSSSVRQLSSRHSASSIG